MAKINLEDIEALVRTFEASPWQELEFSSAGCELFLSKTSGAGPTWIATPTCEKQSGDSTNVQFARGNPAGGAQETGPSTATSHISEPGPRVARYQISISRYVLQISQTWRPCICGSRPTS